MNHEDILKKLLEAPLSDGSRLISATSLLSANRTEELTNASILLAKTTKESAELLAKITKESAELLAKITKESAEQLKKRSEISEKQMELLTVVLIMVGAIQIIIAVVALFISFKE